MKSSTDSSRYNSSTDSRDGIMDDQSNNQHYHRHIPRKQKSVQKQSTKELKTKLRRKKLLEISHTSSHSLSLEDIFFEGLLSEGISDPNEKRKRLPLRRTISFEDLPAVKKELSESSQEDYVDGLAESEQYCQYTLKTTSKPKKATNRQLLAVDSRSKHKLKTNRNLHQSSLPADSAAIAAERYMKLSKNDIINLWKSSEYELLNRLDNVMQQNRALEEKLTRLEGMLMKPP